MAYKMNKSYFAATPSGGSELVLSGDNSGLTPPTITPTSDAREVPSQSDWRRQESSGITGYTLEFTVDRKATTEPIFGWIGNTIAWEFGPNGNGSGEPKQSGSAIVTSVTPEVDGNSYRLGVATVGDGEITYGTY